MNYSIILLILAFAVLAATQTPPVFPEQYQVDFDETAKFLSSGTTKGTIYYDSKNNRQVITRENGKFDRYCGSVYKTSNTPCNHIVVEGNYQKIQTRDSLTSPLRITAASAVTAPMDAESSLVIG